jgi:hypothetical protein
MRSPDDCDAGAPGNRSGGAPPATLGGAHWQSVVAHRKVFAKNWIN